MELLIPLLFFAIPVAIAILDKRARAGKAPGQPAAPPAFREKAETAHPRPAETALPKEGERAIIQRRTTAADDLPHKTGKTEIDKKKLILYSELLKPKFDE